MKTTLALLLVLTFGAACADRGGDPAQQLRHAQELLAAKRYDDAFAEFTRIAEKHDSPLAQFTVGLFYKLGWGRPVDEAEALRWFEPAAEGGIPVAQHYMGEAFLDGRHRKVDPAAAAAWFRRAGRLGHHASYVRLADLYLEGNGVARDPATALEYLKMAADQHVVSAQLRLGRLLISGEAGHRDPRMGQAYLEAATERQSAEAPYHLGVLTRTDAKNHDAQHAARTWFELAASRGYVPAYVPTAELYLEAHEDHEPTPDDRAAAYMWLSAAVARLEDGAEKKRAAEMLDEVRPTLPAKWFPEMEEKVRQHLAAYAR